jgi:hypothetical protein
MPQIVPPAGPSAELKSEGPLALPGAWTAGGGVVSAGGGVVASGAPAGGVS